MHGYGISMRKTYVNSLFICVCTDAILDSNTLPFPKRMEAGLLAWPCSDETMGRCSLGMGATFQISWSCFYHGLIMFPSFFSYRTTIKTSFNFHVLNTLFAQILLNLRMARIEWDGDFTNYEPTV